jgi:hypothetical protein
MQCLVLVVLVLVVLVLALVLVVLVVLCSAVLPAVCRVRERLSPAPAVFVLLSRLK